MRILKWIFILGGALMVLLLLLIAFVFFIRPLTLPVYQFSQQPPAQTGGMATSTLQLGDRVYVSGEAEFPLEMLASFSGAWNRVGRTQDGLDIYRIPGEDPQNYLMMTTEMFPAVIFREKSVPLLQPADIRFDALRLTANPGGSSRVVETSNAQIITEITQRLVYHDAVVRLLEPKGGGYLDLISNQAPGLGYYVYVFTDTKEQVYLANKAYPNDLIPAGPLFADWYKQQLSS